MNVAKMLKEKNITKYKLSKDSGIPYSTINDIVSGGTRIAKCTGETLLKLSKALGVSIEELLTLEEIMPTRMPFQLFKNNICHMIKDMGDIDLIVYLLENDLVRKYNERKWYKESFYLLAMLDYLSKENDIPICNNYDDLREMKLADPVYSDGVIALTLVSGDDTHKEQSYDEAIPEFKKYNIIEADIRNVC